MRVNSRIFLLGIFTFAFVLSIGGGMFWANTTFVRRFGGGEQFIVSWQVAKDFISVGLSPYSELSTRSIEQTIYGGPATPGQPAYRFTAPLYIVLLNIPIAALPDWKSAFALALIFSQLALIAIVVLSMRLSRWKSGSIYFIALGVFAFLWLPGANALYTGSAVILQTLFLLAALSAAEAEVDEVAGALLALLTFNAEVFVFALLLILFWAASARRWRIWGGFLMLLTLLGLAAYLLLPSWPGQYIQVIYENWLNVPQNTLLQIFASWFPALGARLAQMIVIAFAAILLLEWYMVRGRPVSWLFWAVALTLVVTPMLGLPVSVSSQVAFLPALILSVSVMEQRWGFFGRWVAIALQASLFILFWLLARETGINSQPVILLLPIILFVMLYWVRWWVARPPRLWADIAAGLR